MLHGCSFFETCFFVTLAFTSLIASNCHILQCQGPALYMCGAHPIKLLVT